MATAKRPVVPGPESITVDMRTRFWAKVDRSGACWIWTGARNSSGHGYFRPSQRPEYWWPHEYAHRFVLMLLGGIVPRSSFVCHHCDNPPCVYPAHLYIGDASSNAKDMAERGRKWKGAGICRQGHPLRGENLYVNKASGQKVCKTCRKGYDRKRRVR